MLLAVQEYGVRALFCASGALMLRSGKCGGACVRFSQFLNDAFELRNPSDSLVAASGIVVIALRLKLFDCAQAGLAVANAPIIIKSQQIPILRAIHMTNSVHLGRHFRRPLAAIFAISAATRSRLGDCSIYRAA